MSVDDLEVGLVRRAQEGDREAFGRLVERHWTRLVRLARSVVGEAEAEDAVQEGLIVAWRKLGTMRDAAAFRRWVTRVVLRICVNEAGRTRSTVPVDEISEPARQEGSMEENVDIERLIRSLAPQQRAVMHLTVVEGMSDSEIGEVLELRAASVRSHRRRAREALSRLLRRQGGKRWVKPAEIL